MHNIPPPPEKVTKYPCIGYRLAATKAVLETAEDFWRELTIRAWCLAQCVPVSCLVGENVPRPALAGVKGAGAIICGSLMWPDVAFPPGFRPNFFVTPRRVFVSRVSCAFLTPPPRVWTNDIFLSSQVIRGIIRKALGNPDA